MSETVDFSEDADLDQRSIGEAEASFCAPTEE